MDHQHIIQTVQSALNNLIHNGYFTISASDAVYPFSLEQIQNLIRHFDPVSTFRQDLEEFILYPDFNENSMLHALIRKTLLEQGIDNSALSYDEMEDLLNQCGFQSIRIDSDSMFPALNLELYSWQNFHSFYESPLIALQEMYCASRMEAPPDITSWLSRTIPSICSRLSALKKSCNQIRLQIHVNGSSAFHLLETLLENREQPFQIPAQSIQLFAVHDDQTETQIPLTEPFPISTRNLPFWKLISIT